MDNRSIFTQFYEDHWGRNPGEADDSTKETAAFWDKKAKDFSQKAHCKDARRETETFLSKFDWQSSETVLDVGSGPGTHAILLARSVKEVTAIDFSSGMLEQLKEKAEQESLNNIRTIQGRWLDIDFEDKFDTVLSLSSLGVISCDNNEKSRLLDTLLKLKGCAKKRLIILIPHADSVLDENMRDILQLGNLTLERRRIAVLYHAMVECGMLPSLEIIERPFRWIFTDINEAAKTLLQKSGIKSCTPQNFENFENYLSKLLKPDENGNFVFIKNTKQALYTNYFKNG